MFISPLSLSLVLSMCFAGAMNETADQLKQLLEMSSYSDSEILRLNNGYMTELNEIDQNNNVEINMANKIYSNVGIAVDDKYAKKIGSYFDAEIQTLDFSDAFDSAQTINEWISDQTNNKINDLIAPDAIDHSTRMILANAVYFKGLWMYEFDSDQTINKDFNLADGTKKPVSMMRVSEVKLKFIKKPFNLGVNVCELPYDGEKFAMTILLPTQVDTNLDTFIAKLTPCMLNDILRRNGTKVKVNLELPKFKIDFKRELKEDLRKLGAQLPFSSTDANFKGMIKNTNNVKDNWYVSSVLHQSSIEINEHGTEATSATSVSIADKTNYLSKSREFVCDHPFMFIIHEKVNNNILFVGKYTSP